MPEWMKGLGAGVLSYFWDEDEGVKYENIIPLLTAYGLSRAEDSDKISGFLGLNSPMPTGYMGGIPDYTYTRNLVPNAFTGYERDNTGVMALDSEEEYIPRRPGGAGRSYFTKGVFAPATTETAVVEEGEEEEEEVVLAGGGLASLNPRGYYLGGRTDGMADRIPATINQRQPARLSDGEFVVPADVVSHLGNGSSNAGADQLFSMMDRVRKARTGRKSQGKKINPQQYLG
tara:strand:+ start:712 stop:1404 length:693 start_codon:yes stop_codon:yes gene_type:complete